ncbi:MAG: TetR/AcrR family transcriptional regulator [Bacteroidales bacterium]|jgi:AcrR family transcriptional regulator|nr:TetR/AcrR family transcriptional regulator [Bacteroidales bacterium]
MRREGRKKDSTEIRKRIMDAALVIALAEGWEAVSVRRIADILEYAPQAVSGYFENMCDLFNELKMTGYKKLYACYDLAIKSESEPGKSLLLISGKHWDFAFRNRQLYQLMFSFDKPARNAEMDKTVSRIMPLFFELTKDMELAGELLFDWNCLLNGFIFHVMQIGVPREVAKIPPKTLLIRAVERLLSSTVKV